MLYSETSPSAIISNQSRAAGENVAKAIWACNHCLSTSGGRLTASSNRACRVSYPGSGVSFSSMAGLVMNDLGHLVDVLLDEASFLKKPVSKCARRDPWQRTHRQGGAHEHGRHRDNSNHRARPSQFSCAIPLFLPRSCFRGHVRSLHTL